MDIIKSFFDFEFLVLFISSTIGGFIGACIVDIFNRKNKIKFGG